MKLPHLTPSVCQKFRFMAAGTQHHSKGPASGNSLRPDQRREKAKIAATKKQYETLLTDPLKGHGNTSKQHEQPIPWK